MINVIGVRFKKTGKIYYFDPEGQQIPEGTPVIVETARGIEMGDTALSNRDVMDDDVIPPLKKVIRIATNQDIETDQRNKKRELDAFDICIDKIKKHKLEMRLVDVELTFDHNKIIFYFTADGRVDFRELVKDLAAVFRTRIELRQIGVRDEAKLLNGIGICGRTLCCATFLSEFQPVSIRMAKDQNLSLNPTKISGICGRLMCCLKYEEETYEHLTRKMPLEGDIVQTPDGRAEVLSVNILRQIVKTAVKKGGKDTIEVEYYAADEIKLITRTNKPEKDAGDMHHD